VKPSEQTNRFRLDRAVSVGLMHPLMRWLDRRRKGRVPILMYHGIRGGLSQKHPYFETATSAEQFAAHMQHLRDYGFVPIHLHQAIEEMHSHGDGSRNVVITFDDGYRDFYTHAFPILAEHQFKATMFIVTGRTGDAPVYQDGNEWMTWSEVREIRRNGIEIGSHTVSHPQLHSMGVEQVDCEIRQSKEMIEDRLGESVSSFSYPYAFPEQDKAFVRLLRSLLESYGYKNGVSTVIGTATCKDDRFFLPRLPANSYDDLTLYRAKLERGYDWLHLAQLLYKRGLKSINTYPPSATLEADLLGRN